MSVEQPGLHEAANKEAYKSRTVRELLTAVQHYFTTESLYEISERHGEKISEHLRQAGVYQTDTILPPPEVGGAAVHIEARYFSEGRKTLFLAGTGEVFDYAGGGAFWGVELDCDELTVIAANIRFQDSATRGEVHHLTDKELATLARQLKK